MKKTGLGFVCLMLMSQSVVFGEPVQAITIKEEKKANLVTVDRTLAVRISDISENLVLKPLNKYGQTGNELGECHFSAAVNDPTKSEGLSFPSTFKSSYVLDNRKQVRAGWPAYGDYVSMGAGGDGRGNGYTLYGSVVGVNVKRCTAEVATPAISKLLEKLPKLNGVPVLKIRMFVEEPLKTNRGDTQPPR
jgi:hypothetical protein